MTSTATAQPSDGTLAVVARVYVSSTSGDLEEQRKAVSEALRRLEHVDVAMEYYVAEDRPPLDRCLADVRSCDVYVGIFAWRYGGIPRADNPEGLSYTELEYRCAVESGKTCLLFLLSEDADWPRRKMDRDLSRIEDFRQELKSSGRIMNTFETTDELARKVTEAVVAWEKSSGLVVDREPADWHAYREAVLDRHQWVRLQVIAGASRKRDPLRIPLTEVFEPQLVIAGTSGTDVPDEVRQYQQEIYGARVLAPETSPDPPGEAAESGDDRAETEEQLFAGSPEQVLDIFGRERTQVFLGGPGAGKSTLLQYAMLQACNLVAAPDSVPGHLSGGPVPFLIELRTYVLRDDPDFISHLVRRAEDFYGVELSADSITRALTTDGKALVFFDGLDEVFDPKDRRRVIEQFQAFARGYPGCRIAVTSRIAGYDPTSLGLAGFAHYTVLPLTLGHIRNFADRWYRHYTLAGTERTAQGLVQRIVESPRLLDLAGNPLLLTMMAVIYKDRDLPNERWRLYERCAETLLEDWDLVGKGFETEDFKLAVAIRTAQKSEMLQRVARYMLDHAQPGSELNAIAYGPLRRILVGYLTTKYQRPEGEAEAIAVDILKHLMERTYVLAGVGERVFGFVHRTFMEYFAACSCLAEFNSRKSDYRWLNEEIFGAHWEDPAWEEVLLLLIAMLRAQGTPVAEVVEHLRRLEKIDPVLQAILVYPPYSLAFAARCLGEVGDIQDQAQANEVLARLAAALRVHACPPRSDEDRRFVEKALEAFAALAPLVGDGPATVAAEVGALKDPEVADVTTRMVAWQMEFALRSRKERLEFALGALRDREEAVRRGAIAALEREWPGRADVAPSLAEVVETDRNSRVRIAALLAMQRSWRHDPAILDAIASRAGVETAYTVAVQFIEYLASTWPGNPRALELLMRLAYPRSGTPERYDYVRVFRAVLTGVARGWPDAVDVAGVIARNALLHSSMLRPRGTGGEILAILRDWVADNRNPLQRRTALLTIADDWRWYSTPEMKRFLLHATANDPDPVTRAELLTALGRERTWIDDADIWTFLHQRALDEPDPSARRSLLVSLARRWARIGKVWNLLLDRAEHDSDEQTRTALREMLEKRR